MVVVVVAALAVPVVVALVAVAVVVVAVAAAIDVSGGRHPAMLAGMTRPLRTPNRFGRCCGNERT